MKQLKLTWFLAAFTLMLIMPFTGKTHTKTKPTTDFTLYYWFYTDGTYAFRQSTVDAEMALTGLNEGIYLPRTLVENGYGPASVWLDENGIPVPFTFADKKLYWHE